MEGYSFPFSPMGPYDDVYGMVIGTPPPISMDIPASSAVYAARMAAQSQPQSPAQSSESMQGVEQEEQVAQSQPQSPAQSSESMQGVDQEQPVHEPAEEHGSAEEPSLKRGRSDVEKQIEDTCVHFCPSLSFATGRLLEKPIRCTPDGHENVSIGNTLGTYMDSKEGVTKPITRDTLIQLCTERCVFVENASSSISNLLAKDNKVQLTPVAVNGGEFLIRGIFFAQRHALLIGTIQKWEKSRLRMESIAMYEGNKEYYKKYDRRGVARLIPGEVQRIRDARLGTNISADTHGIRRTPNGCDFIFPGDILLMVESERRIIMVTAGNNSANVVFQMYMHDFLRNQLPLAREPGPDITYSVEDTAALDTTLHSILTNFFWWYAENEGAGGAEGGVSVSGHILELFPDPMWVSLTVPDYRRREANGEAGAGVHFYDLANRGRDAAGLARGGDGMVLRLLSGRGSHGNVPVFLVNNNFSLEDMLAFVRAYSPTELYANDLYGFFNIIGRKKDEARTNTNYYTKRYMDNLESVSVQVPGGTLHPYEQGTGIEGVYPNVTKSKKGPFWSESTKKENPPALAVNMSNPMVAAKNFHRDWDSRVTTHRGSGILPKTGMDGETYGVNSLAMAAMPDFYLSDILNNQPTDIFAETPAMLPMPAIPTSTASPSYQPQPASAPLVESITPETMSDIMKNVNLNQEEYSEL